MRIMIIIALTLCYQQCFLQADYEQTLSRRLTEIKELQFYDDGVVIHVDSVEYGDANFPYWKKDDRYFQDDLVRFKYCLYRALEDSVKGNRPDTALTHWAVSAGPHPYLFLRDTATVADLRKLMQNEHPYVRCYAFGALSYRNAGNLFPMIVDNLGDTTTIGVAGCVFTNAFPADLMIECAADRLDKKEKQQLQKLLSTRYKYLTRGLAATKR